MAQDYQQLWKDLIDTTDDGKAVRVMAEILVDKEGRLFVSRLEKKDTDFCIEILDIGIGEHNLKSAEKQAFFVTLRRLVGCSGRLPSSMIITEHIEVSEKILASGGFSDTRSGRYKGGIVAVKTLRVSAEDNFMKIRKQFCKEVVLWNTLSHPNVMKLVGVYGDMGKGQFTTVTEWMVNGNIMEFIKANHVNRLELLHGAAKGLKYLHLASLTHGDLKGANILMSNDTPPRACLADFGFMTLVLDPVQPISCSGQLEGDTTVFMSPELLMPWKFGREDPVPTSEADIYAFGLVVLQVLTGEIPFRGLRHTELGMSVVLGTRPGKPENASAIGLSDSLWSLIQRCWCSDMKSRPKVGEVVTHLGEAVAQWDGLMPPHTPSEGVALESKEELLYLMEHCRTFQSSPSDVPEAPKSLSSSGLLTRPNTPSPHVALIEPPREGSQEVPIKSLNTAFPHLNQNHKPPPSQFPRRKREYVRLKVRELLGLWC